MIDKLVHAGMDVARLNFSHGTHEDRVRMVAALRRASAHYEKPIGVLADLQGPKIRTGKLVNGKPIRLRFGQRFVITTRNIPGTEEAVSTTFRALPESVRKGDRILLSDGDIALRVISAHGQDVVTQVENGGDLGEHKGINLPGIKLDIPSMTAKDRKRSAISPDPRRGLSRSQFRAHRCGRARRKTRHRSRRKRYAGNCQARKTGSHS